MKLRTKLLLAQAPVFLALVLVVTATLLAVRELGGAPASIFRENFRSFDAGRGMLVAIEAIDRDVAAAAVNDAVITSEVLAPHLAAFERELAVQEGNVTEAGEREATQRLRSAWGTYVAALESDRRENAQRDLERAVEEILAINRDAMRGKADAAAAGARRTGAQLLVTAILSLVLAVVTTAWWLRRLLAPLGTMDHAVHRLAAGDFEARIEIEGNDEVAVLARSVDGMAERIDAYRKSSLGELLRANNRLESVMDSLPDAVIVYDLEGGVAGHNRVAADLLGGDALALDALPEGLDAAVRKAFERVREEGEPFATASLADAVEIQLARGPCWVTVGATPVRAASGAMEGVTVGLRDVTKTRRLEGFRADLVAAAAHELKTPLTSLQLAVHLCVDGTAGPLTPRQTEVLTAARQDCDRLENVVNDLLEMAKLESGSARLEPQATAIATLVADAIARHDAEAKRHRVSLDAHPSEATLRVNVDLERIRHVFDNVIENAIKYGGDEGSVQIGWHDDPDGVRVFVDDMGPGVPADMRERVFAKFVRVPGTKKRGSGLGLNIARDIVAAHGGTIGIDASPHGGARVWFVLPRA